MPASGRWMGTYSTSKVGSARATAPGRDPAVDRRPIGHVRVIFVGPGAEGRRHGGVEVEPVQLLAHRLGDELTPPPHGYLRAQVFYQVRRQDDVQPHRGGWLWHGRISV